MMQAAWYEKNGPADEVLRVGEKPIPVPGPGEIRVRVVCSGVNPSDVKSRAGSRPVTSGYIIPHSDGAGIVDEVGPGVTTHRVGDRVWLWNAQYKRPFGTAAEYVALPADQAVPLPESVSFEAGACLGIPALTAFRAVEIAEIHPGQTILVIGGASAVGFYAVQIAKARGARVIATVGDSRKADFLRRIGVSETILYKRESVLDRVLAMTNGAGVDAIIDMDFSTSAPLSNQGALRPFGRHVCYGSNDRGSIPVNFATWLSCSLSLHFFLVYELRPDERKRAIDGIQAMMKEGSLEHHVGPTFALPDIVKVHQAVESGSAFGNVVMYCQKEDFGKATSD